jgi:hypothetical protein
MSEPYTERAANSAEADDKSGVAVWRYTNAREAEVIVRQRFDTFQAALGINELVRAAFCIGEAEGYAKCETSVLDALKGR